MTTPLRNCACLVVACTLGRVTGWGCIATMGLASIGPGLSFGNEMLGLL